MRATLEQLINRSRQFHTNTLPNKISNFLDNFGEEVTAEILENANNTYPMLHEDVVILIKDFLSYKMQYGSPQEKLIYEALGINNAIIAYGENISEQVTKNFITRLLTKRPLVFMDATDTVVNRPDATEVLVSPNADRSQPTEDYISYDEMQIAAFIGISSPSFFINDGNRQNRGIPGEPGSFINKGIIVGQVGARFEREGVMEFQHMLITPEQNTVENGYGSNGVNKEKFSHWAKFYGLPEGFNFPAYEEVLKISQEDNKKYIKITAKQDWYLNAEIYKVRMKKIIETFLIEANSRAFDRQTTAYVHAIGLGIGVWAIDAEQQTNLLLEVYAEVLQEHFFQHINTIDFSWFLAAKNFGNNIKIENSTDYCFKYNNINIIFSRNNPQSVSEEKNDKLLVVQYAWDSGAFSGNEYWAERFTASSDPAAASSSQIADLQNPLINPYNVCGETLKIATKDSDYSDHFDYSTDETDEDILDCLTRTYSEAPESESAVNQKIPKPRPQLF